MTKYKKLYQTAKIDVIYVFTGKKVKTIERELYKSRFTTTSYNNGKAQPTLYCKYYNKWHRIHTYEENYEIFTKISD